MPGGKSTQVSSRRSGRKKRPAADRPQDVREQPSDYLTAATMAADTGAPKFSPGPPDEQDIGLGEIFRALNRRKWVIFATVLVFMLLAGLMLSQLTPRFTGQTLLMIESRGATIVSVESVMAGLAGDKETIRSEAEILRSRTLAGRVIDKLELDADPEFNSALRPPGALARLMERVGWSGDAERSRYPPRLTRQKVAAGARS